MTSARVVAMVALLCGAMSLATGEVAARPSGGSSGRSSSFSRPSASPSFSRPAAPQAAPAAPSSSSSGFSRPSANPTTTAPPVASSAAPRPSAADQTMSRRASSESYTRYQSQKTAADSRFAQPGSTSANTYGYRPSGAYGSYNDVAAYRSNWYGGMGYSAPGYMFMSRPNFGMWDAMFMWWMLDSMSSHNHDRFFYDNRSDPGYQDWRKEADRLAQDNAQLKEKLAGMDKRVAEIEHTGAPATPGALPDDVKPDVALAAEHVVTPDENGSAFSAPATPATPAANNSWIWWLVGGGTLFGLLVVPKLVRRAGA